MDGLSYLYAEDAVLLRQAQRIEDSTRGRRRTDEERHRLAAIRARRDRIMEAIAEERDRQAIAWMDAYSRTIESEAL